VEEAKEKTRKRQKMNFVKNKILNYETYFEKKKAF
jgi:hypothetical protein